MPSWNDNSNIATDFVRKVKFKFDTDQGPGDVTLMINRGITIEFAKKQLLTVFGSHYNTISISGYEILDYIAENDDDRTH